MTDFYADNAPAEAAPPPAPLPEQPPAAPRRRTKRKRGGQPGNTNALLHGAYSDALTPEETERLNQVLATETTDPELARLRVKLELLPETSPDNSRAVKTLTRRFSEQYCRTAHLTGQQKWYAAEILKVVVQYYAETVKNRSDIFAEKTKENGKTNRDWKTAVFPENPDAQPRK